MIGRIQGTILQKTPPQLLIDVGGIGYEILAPMSTFYRLPEIGQKITLLTHLIVREDAHILYGFTHERERTLFRNLIKVTNIGPKSALTILSGIEPDTFAQCVINSDIATLSSLPGIGKKTAERLVIEMRDKLTTAPEQNLNLANDTLNEAMSALIALGYKPQEAQQALMRIENQNTSSEELIRLALQNMMKGSLYVNRRSPD